MSGNTKSGDERFRVAVENSPSGLLMTDAAGRIVLVNREIERIFGYTREELVGCQVEMLIPEPFRAGHIKLRAGFTGGTGMRPMAANRDLFGRRKDGSEVPVDIGLMSVMTDEGAFILAAVVDVSGRKKAEFERRQLEEELRQAQKMEAVGRLAGGIAHDFNNVLGAILGFAELARDTDNPDEALKDIDGILVAATRGRALIDRLMRFSRRQEMSLKPLDLAHTVRETLHLLQPALSASVEIRLRIGPQPPLISGDTVSIQQVLMNLATNAAHAMPKGGTMEITVEEFHARDGFVRMHAGLREGHYVMLIVRDTGGGMDEATRARAFEPFFTTKPQGEGSGLGLTMVHNIMHNHDGAVWIESEPDKGTTVRCVFPALDASTAVAVPESPPPAPTGRGERILHVDDEVTLTLIVKRRLEKLGYSVTVETDPVVAIAIFKAAPREFDLVITDYFMPGMNGLELAREVNHLRPDIPIAIVTGYMEDFPADEIRRAGVRIVMKKPTTQNELAAAVHTLLKPAAARR